MDFGHRGPAAQPGRKLIERRWRAGRQNLDPTILQIPCPAIDTESQRLPCRAGAKPHPLNTTGNEEPPGSDAPGHRPITAQLRQPAVGGIFRVAAYEQCLEGDFLRPHGRLAGLPISR